MPGAMSALSQERQDALLPHDAVRVRVSRGEAMSWCRFGSPCDCTSPFQYKADEACERCPGSALYVYEDVGRIVCCCCSLAPEDEDFFAKDEAEMNRHLLQHDANGDHVRKSLLALARGEELELTRESEALRRWLRGA